MKRAKKKKKIEHHANITHNVFKFILSNFGKADSLPFKSLILLKEREKGQKNLINSIFHEKRSLKEEKGDAIRIAYRSVKLVKAEMLAGIGPSRELPWICL